jgi:uncharacterized membrane protein YkoI
VARVSLDFTRQPNHKRRQVNIRSKLVTAAAIGAASVGGAAIATAATSGTPTSGSTTAGSAPVAAQTAARSHDPSKSFHTRNGRSEKLLSGNTEAKVRAAALAKVSGTVDRVETNVDSSAPYEAHIRKADGTEVEVQVNRDFTVAAVNQMGDMGGRHP